MKGWRASLALGGECASCPAGLLYPAWPPWVDCQVWRWLPGSLILSRPGLPFREGWAWGLAMTMGPSVPVGRDEGREGRSDLECSMEVSGSGEYIW